MGSSGESRPRERAEPGHASDLVASLPGIVWEANATDGTMTYVSPKAREQLGHDPQHWMTDPGFWELHIHPNDLAEASIAMEHAIATGEQTTIEYRFRAGDGTYKWVQDTVRVIRDEAGDTRLVGVMVDKTESHHASDPLAASRGTKAHGEGPGGILSSPLHKMVVDNLSDGVFYTDTERRVTYWNNGAARLTGYSAEQILGRHCFDDLIVCVDVEGNLQCGTCPLTTAIGRGWERQQVLLLRHAAGHRVPVSVHTYPIRNQAGNRTLGAVETFSPVPAAEEYPDPTRSPDPFVDQATGLPDRRLIGAVLVVRKDELDRHWLPFGLLIVEVDRLARLAAEYGQPTANQVLRAVAATVRATLRAGDVIVRWSPTEFAIAVSMTDAKGIEIVADRLLRLVRATVVPSATGPVSTTISIGATTGRRREPLEQLYMRAEHAVARARTLGHDRLVLVDAAGTAQGARTLGAGTKGGRQDGVGSPTSS